ncbi:MAG TPA: uroporphyrinogen decarboxylase family protein, partial [Anaerolineae bacterium]
MPEITTTLASDTNKTAEQLVAERLNRLIVAGRGEQPDRIPIFLPCSYYLAEVGGITHQEQQDNFEKAQDLLEQVLQQYQADTAMGLFNDPGPSLVLGDRMTRWPGHQLPATGSFQFDEHEFMKAEDYDAFLADPADWGIRVYMPRAFSELQGLSLLPPLGLTVYGHYALPNLPMLLVPPVAAALKALGEAAEKASVTLANMMRSNERLAALGFPPMIYFGGIAEAPFDLMSDTMRGMRGIFLDMLRCPDKLLAAQEKVAAFQVEYLLSFCQATGAKYVFFPLHRGSDGFMSIKQFEKFYWPQLTGMFDKLIEREITPFVFYEGVWNQRLKHVAALPKGKTIGWFQA